MRQQRETPERKKKRTCKASVGIAFTAVGDVGATKGNKWRWGLEGGDVSGGYNGGAGDVLSTDGGEGDGDGAAGGDGGDEDADGADGGRGSGGGAAEGGGGGGGEMHKRASESHAAAPPSRG